MDIKQYTHDTTKISNVLITGPIGPALIKLSIPIIFANILQSGYQLTDAFWVGRLGEKDIAAVSISFPVIFLVIAMGSGLAMAGAVLTAQYAGSKRQDMVNHIAAQTLLMVIVVSIIFSIIGYIITPPLLELLGVTSDVYNDALGFMRVSFINIVFVFLYLMFQALMRGIGQTTAPLLITSGTVILNFIIDPLLIFGWGPLQPMGVMGAAIATLITQALATIISIIILVRGKHGIQLSMNSLRPDLSYMKQAFFLGFPGSIELSTRALGLMMMSFIVTSFGTLPLASYGIGSNILQFVTIPSMGLSAAISTLVGQNIGAGNLQRAVRITMLGALSGFIALSIAGIIAYIFAPMCVAFFAPDNTAVITQGAEFIRIMSLTWGGIGIQLCIVAAFRASGNMIMAMVIALVSQWMVQFPIAYILSKHTILHVLGIWWSFPITNIIVSIIAICWFANGSWKKTRITYKNKLIQEVTEQIITKDTAL